MANTIDSKLVDRMYAMALQALRKKTSILRYVTVMQGGMGSASQKYGSVLVPIPFAYPDATDVTAANTPPAGNDTTPDFAEVTLNNWKETSFYLTDEEMGKLQAGTLGMQMEEAVDALARTIIKSVLSTYTGIYNHVGAAGTTPFASDTSVAQSARKLLNQNGVPTNNRALILNFDAEENAIGLPLFQRVNESGDDSVMREGYIGRRLGFDWDTDAYMPSFTGGTLSNGTSKAALINNASVAIGDTSVPMDSATLTGTLVVGDLFTVAGDSQQYVVTAAATASGNAVTVSFDPPAKVAWADNAVVTFVADHDVAGLALQSQAIAFASRPLVTDIPVTGGNEVRTFPDPHSGLVLTMEISRQHKRTAVDFSALWGCTLVRPQAAVRVLG